jgi:hypothetical protein
MNTWLMATIAWPLSQTARLNRFASQGRWAELRHSFLSALVGSTLLAVLGAALILVGLRLLSVQVPTLVNRMADLPSTSLLLLAGVLHNIIFCIGVALRSRRQDPLLLMSAIGGLVSVATIWIGARVGSFWDVAFAYLVCTALSLIAAAVIFSKNSAEWERPPASAR